MVSARYWVGIPLLLSLVAQVPTRAIGAAECTPIVGRLVSIDGQVEVQRGDDSLWQPATLDDSLCERDTVRTGARSRAAVMLINEAVLRLDQQTTVRLVDIAEEEQESSFLDLILGAFQSFSRSPRVLEVNTPYLNATIEGTEFVIRAEANRTLLTVFEGVVAAANPHGSAQVAGGQSVAAASGQPPTPYALVRPRDAVQWALYYPPVDAALEEAPLDERDARFHLREAGQLLSVGRVDEARDAIERALAIDPNAGLAYALRAIIAVVQNDKTAALADARRAVELEPRATAPKIALSYAQQAHFDLESARDTLLQATEEQPQDALAWARLAELWLMLGYRDRAREAADRAANLAPDLERVHLVRGFAALAEFDTRTARAAFERAIVLDSEDPLPHFGLGLAMIRDGALEEGRRKLEVAVGLDSSNSLLRSYLGKAYFEEKRDPLDADQLAIAKELDPLDPTPYLYDAIRLQTENRPGEALQAIQKSIELNDNRAIYRSRQGLDQDRAARGTSVGRIYDDLGFQQLGVHEASKSLTLDPGNASAHRFLSDIYGGMRRTEVARVSEQLQAQMLQDININPVQPSLSETNLNIVTRGGPAEAGFNEFTPLFERNDIQLDVSGLAGDDDTFGGEGVVSALYDRFSISAGAFHYETDGWRPNHDINHDIYNAFAQYAITPELNVQIELRHRESETGDLEFNFDRDPFFPNLERELDQDIARAGFRYSPSPNSDFLFSFIYSDRDEQIRDADTVTFAPDILAADLGVDDAGYQVEGQYLYRNDWFNLTAGASFTGVDRTSDTLLAIQPAGIPLLQGTIDSDIVHPHGYVYANIDLAENLTWTVGLSIDSYDEDPHNVQEGFDKFQVNPKLGVQWNVTDDFLLRGAVFNAVKPILVANRTLEPTQIAGFNQMFDYPNATEVFQYGIGADWDVTDNLHLGAEAVWRDLEAPNVSQADLDGDTVIDSLDFRTEDEDEELYRAYAYWLPIPELALSAEIVFDRFESEAGGLTDTSSVPLDLETFSVPLGLRYFHPSGFFAGLNGTYVHQEIDRSAAALSLGFSDGTDDFFVVDAAVGWRFPDRIGIASLSVMNLFDEEFQFQDDSFREFRDEPTAGPYFPDRTILGRVTLNF
jgi:tetratricopeptide (TPR) repeat protein